METKNKGQEAADDVSALLRARNPLLWVVTREEARVERYLAEAAFAAKYIPRIWDVAQGVTNLEGKLPDKMKDACQDPGELLALIKTRATADVGADRGVWILRDMPVWFEGQAMASTLRQARNLARLLPTVPRDQAQAMIVLSPSGNVPPELAGHATVIDWPLPDRPEIAAILDGAVDALPEFETGKDGKPDKTKPLRAKAVTKDSREAAIDAAVGLSGEEAAACYSRSLVQLRHIDPATVAKEKKRVIAREKVLEWFDPIVGGLDAVGGLENLKAWLMSRSSAYSPKARAYGLPAPKGALLVGISGCGKSLTAKAIATAWGVPLLRLDMNSLKSKFLGESEGNLRRALRVIDAVGRCVVWIDEIEKAMQGATTSSSDGGVSSDALGTILSWMQDRPGEAFVIATANNVDTLPPELLRKGRFDGVWWIDLPDRRERVAVLSAALRFHGRDKIKINLDAVGDACDGFTGAEIAAIVPDALYTAFADDAREVSTKDLLKAAADVVPLSETAAEKIKKQREWAKGRAMFATKPEAERTTERAKRARVVEVD